MQNNFANKYASLVGVKKNKNFIFKDGNLLAAAIEKYVRYFTLINTDEDKTNIPILKKSTKDTSAAIDLRDLLNMAYLSVLDGDFDEQKFKDAYHHLSNQFSYDYNNDKDLTIEYNKYIYDLFKNITKEDIDKKLDIKEEDSFKKRDELISILSGCRVRYEQKASFEVKKQNPNLVYEDYLYRVYKENIDEIKSQLYNAFDNKENILANKYNFYDLKSLFNVFNIKPQDKYLFYNSKPELKDKINTIIKNKVKEPLDQMYEFRKQFENGEIPQTIDGYFKAIVLHEMSQSFGVKEIEFEETYMNNFSVKKLKEIDRTMGRYDVLFQKLNLDLENFDITISNGKFRVVKDIPDRDFMRKNNVRCASNLIVMEKGYLNSFREKKGFGNVKLFEFNVDKDFYKIAKNIRKNHIDDKTLEYLKRFESSIENVFPINTNTQKMYKELEGGYLNGIYIGNKSLKTLVDEEKAKNEGLPENAIIGKLLINSIVNSREVINLAYVNSNTKESTIEIKSLNVIHDQDNYAKTNFSWFKRLVNFMFKTVDDIQNVQEHNIKSFEGRNEIKKDVIKSFENTPFDKFDAKPVVVNEINEAMNNKEMNNEFQLEINGEILKNDKKNELNK